MSLFMPLFWDLSRRNDTRHSAFGKRAGSSSCEVAANNRYKEEQLRIIWKSSHQRQSLGHHLHSILSRSRRLTIAGFYDNILFSPTNALSSTSSYDL